MSNRALDPSLAHELLAAIKAQPDGADLLITAFYTAAHHYRRSTICTPFPSDTFLRSTNQEKDFPALHRALEAIPAVHSVLGDESSLRRLPADTLALLAWLLINPQRRRRFSLAPLIDLVHELRQRTSDSWKLPAFAGHNTPTYILRAHDGHEQAPFRSATIAYHGTHLENLHSIIHTGLQSMSGTRLQRTGAIFGNGIYMSTNYDTAFSFCQPLASWPRSRFGARVRVLLVCEVDMERATTESSGTQQGERAGAPGMGAAASSGGIPETYLVVQRSDAVRLLYVMVYCDQAAAVRTTRVNWCTVLVLVYAGFLIGKALWAGLKQHRYF